MDDEPVIGKAQRRAIKKQVEDELELVWNSSRPGPFLLTKAARAQLMASVLQRALAWGGVATVTGAIFMLGSLGSGKATGWWTPLLLGPVVFFGYFLIKRKSALDQVEAGWLRKWQGLIDQEVQRRCDLLKVQTLIKLYGATLERASSRLISDVCDLPASKQTIKKAILRALEIEKDEDRSELLKVSYVSLAAFQDGGGKAPSGIMKGAMTPSDVAAAIPSQELLEKVQSEEQMLINELKLRGYWHDPKNKAPARLPRHLDPLALDELETEIYLKLSQEKAAQRSTGPSVTKAGSVALTCDDKDKFAFMKQAARHWLDEIIHDAFAPGASERLKQDYLATMKWLGVADHRDLDEQHRERWVNGFIQYLAEGRAPSPDLEGSFCYFRDNRATKANSLLTDDIRKVMAGLLSPDQ